MTGHRSLAALLLFVTSAGCAPGLLKRASLSRQLATREVEVAFPREEPPTAWLEQPPGSSEGDPKLGHLPKGLAEAVREAKPQRALAVAFVEAGNREGHLRLLHSPLPGPSTMDRGLALAEAPAPGREVVSVGVVQVIFVGSAAGDRPLLLGLALRAEHASTPGNEVVSSVAVQATAYDPVPRTLAEWSADGGKAVTRAVEALIERGAPRLLAELTSVTGAPFVTRGSFCGLTPLQRSLEDPLPAGTATVRWAPYTPTGEGLPPLRIAYDVRAWRVSEAGYEPVLAVDGLDAPVAELETVPGGEYALTARATVEAPGGRRIVTPWSAPTPWPRTCTTELEPRTLLRRFAGPRHPVAVRTSILPASGEASADGATPAVVRTHAGPARVVSSKEPIHIGFTRGPTRPGEAAAKGAGLGAVYGLGESFRCLVFMPLCAMVLVPVGAVAGGVGGAVEEAKLATGEGPRADLLRGLAMAVDDRELPRLLMDAGAADGTVASEDAAEPGELEIGLVRASLTGGKTEAPATTLEVEVAATLRRPGAPPERRALIAIGPGPLAIALWLRNDQAVLRGAIRAQASRAARELVRGFASPAQPPPPPAPPPDVWPDNGG